MARQRLTDQLEGTFFMYSERTGPEQHIYAVKFDCKPLVFELSPKNFGCLIHEKW